jgi:BlaI family penicillinase repressor
MKSNDHVPLSGLELEVMNVVWDLGDCSSAQVVERYQSKRALAPTTIRTVLSKLREKGYIKQIPSMQRGFMFSPVVAREKVARRSLRELLGSLFDGSPKQAISYLLEEEIGEDELKEIRAMLNKQKRRGVKK